ncbi:ATP-binding cassette sub-family B member 10, mitochondrial-like [Watersipora subatra]|uniref:ATP-binding cassette sub-family B member 10, mitochondrial-like n=1 Tax=Watersipora subatra TaxID=2589382 RepID=UPI00355BE2A8
MLSRLLFPCNGRGAKPLSLRGVPLLLMRSAPVDATQSFKQIPKRFAQSDSKRSRKGEIWSLLALAQPEKSRLIAAVGLLFISTGVTMTLPYAVGRIIDVIYSSHKDGGDIKDTLIPITQVLAAIFVIGAAANFGRVYFIQTSGQRLVKRLRSQAFTSIMKQETAFFDKNRTGELINRLSSDTTVVANSVTQNISDGLRAGATALVSTGMMVYTSPMLSMIGLGIVPFVAMMSLPFGRYIKKLSGKVQDSLALSTQVSEERISNIRTVRAFGRERYETIRYDDRVEDVLRLSYSESLARACFFCLTGLVGNSMVISVLYVGGMLVSSDSITIGQLSSFMLYVVFTGTAVSGLSSFYTELMKGLGSSTRLFELINRQPEIPADVGVVPDRALSGDISLANVKFSYPTRPDIPIFTDLSLNVPAGKVTAVVGPSGSGKSTIAALLLRLYNIDGGRITIDDIPVDTIHPQWLREHVGLVAQEPVLFSTSIRENITYGVTSEMEMDKVTTEQIVEAAKQANAWSFISSFPEGLDTLVGERGIMLSGGQKQRVALARALLKDPKILVLDEATSALDSESEALVQEALQRIMVGRTVIVIAHRLSTIRHADNIVVLSEGKVVETGWYDELMAVKDGVFSNLILKQLQHQTQLNQSDDA